MERVLLTISHKINKSLHQRHLDMKNAENSLAFSDGRGICPTKEGKSNFGKSSFLPYERAKHRHNEERGQRGPPNKEQNLGEKDQNGIFLGCRLP